MEGEINEFLEQDIKNQQTNVKINYIYKIKRQIIRSFKRICLKT